MSYLHFEVIKNTKHYSIQNTYEKEFISLDVILAANEFVEIDDIYFLASKKSYLKAAKEKEEAECLINIIKKSELTEEHKKSAKLEKDDIGYAAFFSASDTDFDYIPAKAFFSIYVNDDSFEEISKNISNKLNIKDLAIELKGLKNEFVYDVNNYIWDTKEGSEHLSIKAVNFSFFYKNEPDVDEELLKEKDEITKTERLELGKKIEFIKATTAIIAAAALIQMYNFFN